MEKILDCSLSVGQQINKERVLNGGGRQKLATFAFILLAHGDKPIRTVNIKYRMFFYNTIMVRLHIGWA
jgi:hypothetical protein